MISFKLEFIKKSQLEKSRTFSTGKKMEKSYLITLKWINEEFEHAIGGYCNYLREREHNAHSQVSNIKAPEFSKIIYDYE